MVVVCGPRVICNAMDMHEFIHHHYSKGYLQKWNCGRGTVYMGRGEVCQHAVIRHLASLEAFEILNLQIETVLF